MQGAKSYKIVQPKYRTSYMVRCPLKTALFVDPLINGSTLIQRLFQIKTLLCGSTLIIEVTDGFRD